MFFRLGEHLPIFSKTYDNLRVIRQKPKGLIALLAKNAAHLISFVIVVLVSRHQINQRAAKPIGALTALGVQAGLLVRNRLAEKVEISLCGFTTETLNGMPRI